MTTPSDTSTPDGSQQPAVRRAHLVQPDISWENPPENHERIRQLLDPVDVRPGDLILLPEMFATGFSFNIQHTNDKSGATLSFMIELAQDFSCYVQGGRTVAACHKAACSASNVMTTITPRGDIACEYTKLHPFSIGGEHETFAPGADVTTWLWGDRAASAHRSDTLSDSHTPGFAPLRVCPAICYDLRFPELFRTATLEHRADVFALGACWPISRQHHWRALAIARAIENQSYMLAVNRTGRDPTLQYAGGSIAVSPKGDILTELGDQPAVASVDIDPREVRRWREKFPALKDARLWRGNTFAAPAPAPA